MSAEAHTSLAGAVATSAHNRCFRSLAQIIKNFNLFGLGEEPLDYQRSRIVIGNRRLATRFDPVVEAGTGPLLRIGVKVRQRCVFARFGYERYIHATSELANE